ncbi:MAG: hypothetical protein WAV31_01710 [Candidatus Moraniibacteriota bacterium]
MEQVIRKNEDEIIEPEKPKGAEIIDLDEKRRDKNEALLEKIERERKEAKERFGNLIALVSERYEELPESMRKDFILHNEEILDSAIELGIKKGFSKEELEKLELSAVLHDMTKADSVPDKYKDIPNYILAVHAKSASEKIPEILTDEYLKEMNIQGDPEMVRQEIARAILEHMGPRPGFMTGILEAFNAKMKSIGENGIEYPEARGKISEALLAADMKSLAGEKGRKKILSIRSNVEFFIKQDIDLCEEYKKYGVGLSQGEAALISGFESALQARDMQKDEENWNWINEGIEKSKEVVYEFSNVEKPILWRDVYVKMKEYEEEKRKAGIREQLDAA